mgnify:CR=1 FL=1
MAVYKGKYIKQSDDTYNVELYTDDTVSETITEIPKESDAKSIILVWHAQPVSYTHLTLPTSDLV